MAVPSSRGDLEGKGTSNTAAEVRETRIDARDSYSQDPDGRLIVKGPIASQGACCECCLPYLPFIMAAHVSHRLACFAQACPYFCAM